MMPERDPRLARVPQRLAVPDAHRRWPARTPARPGTPTRGGAVPGAARSPARSAAAAERREPSPVGEATLDQRAAEDGPSRAARTVSAELGTADRRAHRPESDALPRRYDGAQRAMPTTTYGVRRQTPSHRSSGTASSSAATISGGRCGRRRCRRPPCTVIAPTSSTTASASRNSRSWSGQRGPNSARIPSTNAVSLDITMPQPCAAGPDRR